MIVENEDREKQDQIHKRYMQGETNVRFSLPYIQEWVGYYPYKTGIFGLKTENVSKPPCASTYWANLSLKQNKAQLKISSFGYKNFNFHVN